VTIVAEPPVLTGEVIPRGAVAPASTDLIHEFTPYGSAVDLFHARDREVLLVGPAGTGKSRVALEKLNMSALLNPGMKGLIVRKTLVSLGTTALMTWRKFIIPEALESGTVEFYGGGPQEPAGYRYDNGSFIGIGGMDRPLKIMSSEWDIIYCMEATELVIDDWEALLTRLRNWVISYQQIMADCNPGHPTHWLKARSDNGKVRAIESRHRDNPRLFDQTTGLPTEQGKQYLSILDGLTGVRRLRLLQGLWAAAEGLIYKGYDPAVHLIDSWVQWPETGLPPQDWKRFWSVDFGYTNPFVLQCWAEDPDGRLYLYRELYRTKRLVEDHARDIMEIVRPCLKCCGSSEVTHYCWSCTKCKPKWNEPEPYALICDHDAEDRATLERYLELGTDPAQKGKKMGIQAVEARLKVLGDGKPRIYLCRDALVRRDTDLDDRKLPCSTIEEIVAYVWKVDTQGREKEEPLDENNHGMDAMRYMVYERDGAGQPGLLVVGGRT
jgi:hypothetical protein